MLEQGFIDKLKKLIAEQGKEALLDPKIFNKYIHDYRGSEYKKESQKLVEALEAGIARAIDGADDLAACKKAKIIDLEQELSPAWAEDIVNTLAFLLRGDTTVTVSASAEKAAVEKPAAEAHAQAAPERGRKYEEGEFHRNMMGHLNEASRPNPNVEKPSADPMYSKWHVVRTFKGHKQAVQSVAFSPDGRHIVSGSGDNTLKLWETTSGRLVRTFEGHEGVVSSVAFNMDGRHIVSGSSDHSFRLWETTSGRLVHTFFAGDEEMVQSVAFSPDGRYIVSVSDDKILNLFETTSRRFVRSFEGHTKSCAVSSIVFSPDGRYIVSGSFDNTLKLWETTSGRLVRTFAGHEDHVNSVAFSPDGRHIVSGSDDKTLKLWEPAGRLVRTFKNSEEVVTSVAFSPDGQYILSGLTGLWDVSLELWETASGRLVRTFVGHEYTVRSVAFSPDGRYIVSGSDDKTLKLWGGE